MSPEQRRRELLDFGERFFAEHAADAFTMDQIAEQAGVSKGLLYHHFGGRRGFYVATVRAVAAKVEAATEPDPSLPFGEAFFGSLSRYLAWVEQNGAIYRVLVQGGLGVDEEVLRVVEGIRRRMVGRIFERLGLPEEGPTPLSRIAAYGWVCFAENACLEWLDQPEVKAPAVQQILTEALLGALRASGIEVGAEVGPEEAPPKTKGARSGARQEGS